MAEFDFGKRLYPCLSLDGKTNNVEQKIIEKTIELELAIRVGITQSEIESFVKSAITKAMLDLQTEPEFASWNWEKIDDEIFEQVIEDLVKLTGLRALNNCK